MSISRATQCPFDGDVLPAAFLLPGRAPRIFRFHFVKVGFQGLQDGTAAPRLPIVGSVGVYLAVLGHRWYCHMADTGGPFEGSKTAIAHPHKSTTDPTRPPMPSLPNYLIDVTRAVASDIRTYVHIRAHGPLLFLSFTRRHFQRVVRSSQLLDDAGQTSLVDESLVETRAPATLK